MARIPAIEQIRHSIEKGHYAEAESLARRRLRDVAARGKGQSLEAAEVLDPLVEALWREGKSRPPETRALAERALAIRERLQGREHLDVATSLSNLCSLDLELSQFDRALPLCERALAIRERALGPNHPDVAMSLEALAWVFWRRGQYEQAARSAERALAIAEKALAPDDPRVARAAHRLASVITHTEPERSRALFARAVAIEEKVVGPEHPILAIFLNSQANYLWWTFADARGAAPVFERALAMAEKTLGPEHPEVGRDLLCWGTMFQQLGDYERARPMLERALAIRQKAQGPEDVFASFTLVGLGRLLMELGDDDAARPLLERALAIDERIHGPQHREVVLSLDNLAVCHINLGDYARAEALLQRSLAIKDKHPWAVADAPQLLAALALKRGDPERARALAEQSLALSESLASSKTDVVPAPALRVLAEALCDLGQPARALPLLDRALALTEKYLGPDSPRLGWILDGVAQAALRAGDLDRAMGSAFRAETIAREHLRLAAPVLAEREVLGYLAHRAGLDVALSVVAANGGRVAGSGGKSWDAVIRSRALALDEMAGRHRSALEVEGPEVARLVEGLGAARQRYANLAVRKSGEENPERYRKLLDEARQEKEQAERALAAKSKRFRDREAHSRASLDQVEAALPAQSALVAWVRYRHHSRAGREPVPSFLAFVLAPGSAAPKLVPLGSAAEIEALVSRWRQEVARGATLEGRELAEGERRCREAGEALRRRVWDPIAKEVGAARRVFLVPDGALQLVNFAALPSGAQSYLVEAGPELHHLSAERDLVRPARAGARNQGLLVLGDPDYEATSLFAAFGKPGTLVARRDNVRAAPVVTRVGRPPVATETSLAALDGSRTVFRGLRSSCGDFARMRFEALGATRAEAEDVAAVWERGSARRPGSQHSAARSLTGVLASEAALKSRASRYRGLHLATHGFFLGGSCQPVIEGTRGIGGIGERSRPLPASQAVESPLLLSGLALAGANRRGAAQADEEDGILTAEEIAALDLSGVEWAVLSGCDTGVGEVRAGEGVLGLRRAFEVAGAGTLVMSLWAVEDEAARRWMRALYEAKFVRGLETPAAVRNASLTVLRERRARGESTHPFTWAAFVAAGDWR